MSSAWSSAASDGADRVGPDLVAALDELDELVDDRARLGDVLVLAVERELVAAQRDRAAEPVAQRVEHAVVDAGELGGDLVRDDDHVLMPPCRGRHYVPARAKVTGLYHIATASASATRSADARARSREFASIGSWAEGARAWSGRS